MLMFSDSQHLPKHFFQMPSSPGYASRTPHWFSRSNRDMFESPSFLWLFLSNFCGSSACIGSDPASIICTVLAEPVKIFQSDLMNFVWNIFQTRIQCAFLARHHQTLLHLHVEEKWERPPPLAVWLGVSSEPLVMGRRRGGVFKRNKKAGARCVRGTDGGFTHKENMQTQVSRSFSSVEAVQR